MTAPNAIDAAQSRELRRSALRSILASGACTVAALVAAQVWLAPDVVSVPVALVLLTVLALLLFAGLPWHPYPRFGTANQVTLLRAELTILLAALAAAGIDPRLPAIATAIATLAALLDALDGWIARRSGMSGRYGARFDMEADAALILVLSLLAWRFGKAGPWICLAGLLRYAFVTGGWLFAWLRTDLPPRRRRQTIAVIQTIGLVVAIAPFVAVGYSRVLLAVCLGCLVLSFGIDVHWLARRRRA